MKLKILHILGYLCINTLLVIITNNINISAKDTGKPKLKICIPKENNSKPRRDANSECVPVDNGPFTNLELSDRVILHSIYASITANEHSILGGTISPIVPDFSRSTAIIDHLIRPEHDFQQQIPRENYWYIGSFTDYTGSRVYVIFNTLTHTVLEEGNHSEVLLSPEDLSRRNARQQWRISLGRYRGHRVAVMVNVETGNSLYVDRHLQLVTGPFPMVNGEQIAESSYLFIVLPEREP